MSIKANTPVRKFTGIEHDTHRIAKNLTQTSRNHQEKIKV